MPFSRPASLDEAVTRLIEGNRRFVEERPLAPVPSAERIELANGQAPFATILGCSDSRVPIETIFDQQAGNLFVVRVAGNIVNDDGLASIEYAVTVLRSMLVVVLGHMGCGAVQTALATVESQTQFDGHMQRLADAIAPAARSTRGEDGDWWSNAVIENVRMNAAAIARRSKIVADAIANGTVRVTGGTYDLHTGLVTMLNERKDAVELGDGKYASDVAVRSNRDL